MRRILLCLILVLVVVPAAAQDRVPAPDVWRLAEFAPADTVLYAAIRTDTGFRESTAVMLDRLEPLLGGTGIHEFFEDLFTEEIFNTFMGDSIALTVLTDEADFDNLLEDRAPVAITFGLYDAAAAETFILDNLGERMRTANGWKVYTDDGSDGWALLRDDVLVVTPHMPYVDQLMSGDYGKLTNDATFQGTTGRLPLDRYDMVIYADAGVVTSAIEAEERGSRPPRRNNEARTAVLSMLGHWAIGGANVGGRDLILDMAWQYGDLSGMAPFGFTADTIDGPPIDPDFAAKVPASTLLYVQSSYFGGALHQTFEMMNVFGALMADDPGVVSPRTQPLINADLGKTARAAATLALAAATGLNLEEDVIEPLDGEFALHFGVYTTSTAIGIAPSAGIVLDESGMGERYMTALTSTLDRAGFPINRISQRGGGEALDLSAFVDPVLMSYEHSLAADPNFDVWFGTNGDVMALGTAPSVQHALTGSGESLADTDGYAHAVEATFLPDAQAVLYINVGALDDVPQLAPRGAETLTALIESVSASARADEMGINTRLAWSLR